MHRLFVAVDLDEDTCAAVDTLSQSLRRDPRLQRVGRASWVRPDRMHLTLHFEGDADESAARHLHDALADPILLAPFQLGLQGLGMFPEQGAPRVLWLGIGKGMFELTAVHDEIRRRLGPIGPTRGTFRPHLTLARFRDRVRRGQLTGLEAYPAAAGPSTIDRVTLYESLLSPTSPSYTVLARAALKATL